MAISEKLIDLVEKVNQNDLEELDEEIEARRRSLDGLLGLRKMLNLRLNGRKPRRPSGNESNGASRRDGRLSTEKIKAAKYILHAGPSKQSVIAQQCKLEAKNLTSFFTHPWFDRQGDGMIALTEEGRKAAG